MAKGSATKTSWYCAECNILGYTTERSKKLQAKPKPRSKFCNKCRAHRAFNGKDAK